MAPKFLQFFIGNALTVNQHILEDLVDHRCLRACLAAHARRVIHHDRRQHKADAKQRGIKAVERANRNGKRDHHRRMGTGHAAGTDKTSPIPSVFHAKIQRNFQRLRNKPGAKRADYHVVYQDFVDVMQPQSPLCVG